MNIVQQLLNSNIQTGKSQSRFEFKSRSLRFSSESTAQTDFSDKLRRKLSSSTRKIEFQSRDNVRSDGSQNDSREGSQETTFLPTSRARTSESGSENEKEFSGFSKEDGQVSFEAPDRSEEITIADRNGKKFTVRRAEDSDKLTVEKNTANGSSDESADIQSFVNSAKESDADFTEKQKKLLKRIENGEIDLSSEDDLQKIKDLVKSATGKDSSPGKSARVLEALQNLFSDPAKLAEQFEGTDAEELKESIEGLQELLKSLRDVAKQSKQDITESLGTQVQDILQQLGITEKPEATDTKAGSDKNSSDQSGPRISVAELMKTDNSSGSASEDSGETSPTKQLRKTLGEIIKKLDKLAQKLSDEGTKGTSSTTTEITEKIQSLLKDIKQSLKGSESAQSGTDSGASSFSDRQIKQVMKELDRQIEDDDLRKKIKSQLKKLQGNSENTSSESSEKNQQTDKQSQKNVQQSESKSDSSSETKSKNRADKNSQTAAKSSSSEQKENTESKPKTNQAADEKKSGDSGSKNKKQSSEATAENVKTSTESKNESSQTKNVSKEADRSESTKNQSVSKNSEKSSDSSSKTKQDVNPKQKTGNTSQESQGGSEKTSGSKPATEAAENQSKKTVESGKSSPSSDKSAKSKSGSSQTKTGKNQVKTKAVKNQPDKSQPAPKNNKSPKTEQKTQVKQQSFKVSEEKAQKASQTKDVVLETNSKQSKSDEIRTKAAKNNGRNNKLASFETNTARAVEANEQSGTSFSNGQNSNQNSQTNVNVKSQAPSYTNRSPEAQQMINQIVEKAQTMLEDGKQSMRMQLQPESLGEVKMEVSIEANQVSARFKVENGSVKQTLNSSLDQLKQSIQQMGLDVDNVDVSDMSAEDGGNEESWFDDPSDENGRGRGGPGEGDEVEEGIPEDSQRRRRLREYSTIELVA